MDLEQPDLNGHNQTFQFDNWPFDCSLFVSKARGHNNTQGFLSSVMTFSEGNSMKNLSQLLLMLLWAMLSNCGCMHSRAPCHPALFPQLFPS